MRRLKLQSIRSLVLRVIRDNPGHGDQWSLRVFNLVLEVSQRDLEATETKSLSERHDRLESVVHTNDGI